MKTASDSSNNNPPKKSQSRRKPVQSDELIKPLTQDQFRNMVDSRLIEAFDCYVVVGYRADNRQAIIIVNHNDDAIKAGALRDLVNEIHVPNPGEE